jgi:hypothetical protein
MYIRMLSAMSAAAALAVVAACANDRSTPVSPESVGVTESEAAPDGSTLKVTAPGTVAPGNGEEVSDATPLFVVTNSQAKFGPTPSLAYRFQLQTENGQAVQGTLSAAGDGRSTWQTGTAVAPGTYRWRARAEMGSQYGPWAAFVVFKQVAPPSLLPPGPYPTDPAAIARFVQNSYPDRGRAGVSLSRRKEDMAFLRDRIIEVGLCVGHQMARNLKRGGPELSYDFLAWKTGGKWWGVDIASGYDDTDHRLELGWHPHAPRSFPSPIPNPEACRN